MTEVGMMECPFCAEQINARAKKCRHCGETIDVALRASEEALRAANRNGGNVYMNSSAAAAVAVPSRGFPHLIHFVLTLFTAGIWLPIWIIHYLIRR